jgi:hypothetical protein
MRPNSEGSVDRVEKLVNLTLLYSKQDQTMIIINLKSWPYRGKTSAMTCRKSDGYASLPFDRQVSSKHHCNYGGS